MTSSRRSAVGLWSMGFVMLILVSVLLVGGANEEPLDPRSVSPQGAKALVDLVQGFGAEVDIGINLPDDRHDVALLLSDTYGRGDRQSLETWARDGGIVVVADVSSALTPRVVFTDDADPERCTIAALRNVRMLIGTVGTYRPPLEGRLCVQGTVAIVPVGAGVIVSIAGPGPLLNEHLDQADNAVLAVTLLAPTNGTRVAFLEPALPVGAGGERIWDLIADPLWILVIQLGVAFGLIAWWQARRLGAPVLEPVAVKIEGSELAVARGRLLGAIRQPGAAAAELRSDTLRRLTRRMSLAPDAPAAMVAQRVGDLGPLTGDAVLQVLETTPVVTDADLLALADRLAQVRSIVLETHHPPESGGQL